MKKRFKENWPCRILIKAVQAKDMPEYMILTYADCTFTDEDVDGIIATQTELKAIKSPVVMVVKQFTLGLN